VRSTIRSILVLIDTPSHHSPDFTHEFIASILDILRRCPGPEELVVGVYIRRGTGVFVSCDIFADALQLGP
jgi:hypothetical protein